jgi:cell division protein DivIC
MQEYLINIWQWCKSKTPKYLQNFYMLTAILFVLWMLLLDVDSMPRQIRKYWGNKELKDEVLYYKEKITTGNQELKGLQKDKEKLERFAREKYYMHRDSEDVFVIEELEKK